MKHSLTLSIIIPTYNEEARILPTLDKIAAYIASHPDYEAIIVDDGSTDQTVRSVEKFIDSKRQFRLIQLKRNTGKGGAVKRGMLDAHGAYRLFTDADLSTPIEEVRKFLDLTPSFDVIIGSRRVEGSNVMVHQPFFREFAGRVFSNLVRLFTLSGFIDTQCGFKLFSAAAAEAVFNRQRIDRFGFDVEALYVAKKLGFRIRETGVIWRDSPATRVRFFRDATRMFTDLITIRMNDLLGKYK